MFSSCVFFGLVTQEPKILATHQGHFAANFGLAIKSGTKEQVIFVDLVAFRDAVVKFVQQYIHKGDLVVVQTKIKPNNYIDKYGKEVKQYKFEIYEIKKLRKQAKPDNKPQPMTFFASSEEADNYIPDDTEFIF